MRDHLRLFVLIDFVAFGSTPLRAHPHDNHIALPLQVRESDGFSSGLVHRFTGMDHPLAKLAVGIIRFTSADCF
ncbi:HupE/UreJ family protein [Schlesneria paludicola]|uniref:HupE/UreJ family protein n=1 Tax=Schlesneria paludicola TaxID=360056 RepID=UPI0012F7D322